MVCALVLFIVQYEEAAIREQLVQDFVPDDMCTLGSNQRYNDIAEHGRESNVKVNLLQLESVPFRSL